MPKAWLPRCSALAISIFFPWFPIHPPVVPEIEQTALAATVSEEPAVLPGVVIEEIPKGSALEKAGLQVGDVILSWERLPNLPANPDRVRGELNSYFDWLELEGEQVRRGEVVLCGRRGGESFELRIEPGIWDAKVRPVISRSLEEIYSTGKTLLASGDPEAAVRVWESLLSNPRDEDGRLLHAWVALRVGEVWGERGDWEKAIEANRAALAASESPSVRIAAWEALGTAHARRNEYAISERMYLSALETRQRLAPESLTVARILIQLGELCWKRRGDLNPAQNYLEQALKICEQLAPQSLAVAYSLNSLGSVAWLRGDMDSAYDLTLRALHIRQRLAPGSLEVAISLNNLATVVWDRGSLDYAHDYLFQALKIQEQLTPGSLVVATILNNIGGVAWMQGDLDRAQDYLIRALHIREELTPRSLSVASTLNNLAAVAQLRDELGRALDYQREALSIEEQLAPRSLRVARSLNNLGSIARDQGELDLAYNYHLQALKIREELAPQALSVTESLNSLGILAFDRSQLDRAEDYHHRALRIREHIAPGSLAVAESLKHLGNVATARAKLDRAYGFYSRALDALENQVLKLGGSYNTKIGFRFQHQDHYYNLLDLLLVQDRLPEAFNVLERFRAQTFLAMLSERDTVFTADIPEELDRERRRLGVLYDRTLKKLAGLNPRDNAEEIEATRREIEKLDDEAGDIEARIRQASPRLAALQYPKPFSTDEAQQTLDPGTLLLSYSVGKEKTALFVLSRSGDLEVKILPLGEAALRSQIKQLLSLIPEVAQGSSLGALRQGRFQSASRELYAALLGPISERIAASERLLILPDGPLHALPFAALARDDGQYLAEWKPFHVALSATVFAELKQSRRPGGGDAAPIQLAAFGDPVYPQSLAKEMQDDALHRDPVVRSAAERGIFDWQPLPYTRREVESIARLFPEGTARTFVGPEALEERIKSLDPKTRILHLAAHGHTDEHLPSSSFVALTIPEDTDPGADDGPDRDNGLLQVWEIFEKVRIDADLVVLSACETALGEEQGGEGLIGLTRAFQYAGARTVMASLWSVQDQATSELMIRFYKHLRAGLPKDEALRQAQIELIRGPIEVVDAKGEKTLLDASSPYFWAGFQLYGDWQ